MTAAVTATPGAPARSPRARRSAARMARGKPFDAVTVLTFYLVLLVAVPSQFIITGFGSVGGPATLVALGAAFWWCWYQIQRAEPVGALVPAGQPVRTAALVLLGTGVASYAAGMLRATPVTEVSTADSGLIRLIAWTGIALVASDGIRDGQRLEVLLRRLVLVGGLVAVIGLVQFATGQTIVDRLSIPGLTSNQAFAAVQTRGGFIRATGTAVHPLEYAFILTMTFPLALTRALEKKGSLIARWWPAALIGAAGAVSLSRSTMLCLAVGLVVMAFSWPPSTRRWMLTTAVAAGSAVFLVVPGMLGVMSSLFTGISSDSSALSRTGSLDLVGTFIARAPVFGRGVATFLPEYRILDNQYLATAIEMGLVGLIALLALVAAAFGCAEAARRTLVTRRPWAQALSASVAAGATGLAFFDGFSFPQAVGYIFLTVGICGAAWRIARVERAGLIARSAAVPDTGRPHDRAPYFFGPVQIGSRPTGR